MRRALVVGINDYPTHPLHGCVNDAKAIAALLARDADGSPNFDVRVLTSDEQAITRIVLKDAVDQLFEGDADTVVFYFAGHGIINPETNAGFLVTTDGNRGGWGLLLSDLIYQANHAYPRVKSSVLILDSCHSGHAGEVEALGGQNPTIISNGVTILTACQRDGSADEAKGQGLFTSILVDALNGGSADVRGNITPASLYSHVDQTLGAWEQRPVYKANVQTFITLRRVRPKVPLDVLRRLPDYFPTPDHQIALDPSYEPDRKNVPEELRSYPVDADKARIFVELQACNRQGLVEPVGAEHMYYAAIESKACRLTAIGRHYRDLAIKNRIVA